MSILCAAAPESPAEPTTSVVGDQVIFDWDEPVANGTPITGYDVYIRKDDLSYIVDSTVCNGDNTVVVSNTECTTQLNKLTAAPFNLLQGYSVFIKIIAKNAYGSSVESVPGNGAIIVLVPEAPINLLNNPLVTTKSVIGFTWDEGVNNGGESVIDYKIQYD